MAQENAVKACEAALEQLSKEGYDQNSDKVMDWERKLNQAKTKLVNLETELQNNEQGLDRNGRAFAAAGAQAGQMGAQMDNASGQASGLSDALSSIGENISLGSIADALHNLDDKMTGVIQKAWDVSKAVYDMAIDSSVWADDLITLSTQTGVDVSTLQQWRYAARFVDTEVTTIIKSFDKLKKQSNSAAKSSADSPNEAAKAFSKLGISATTTDGKVRRSTDLFWDCISAMSRISDAGERDAVAMEIFGTSASELTPLIAAGRVEWEKYCREAEEVGNVLSDDQVSSLGDLNDSWQRLDAKIEALKNKLSSGLAPAFTEVNNSLTSFAARFDEFIQSAEGQEALEALSEAIAELAGSFADQDLSGVVDLATSAIKRLTSAIEWIKDNKDSVVKAIEAIGIAFAGIKVGAGLFDTLKLVASFKLLKLATAGKVAAETGKNVVADAAGTAAASSAGAAAAKTGWLTNLGQTIAQGVAAAAKTMAPVAVPIAAAGAVDAALEAQYVDRVNAYKEQLPAAQSAVEQANQLAGEMEQIALDNVNTLSSLISQLNEAASEDSTEYMTRIKEILGGLTGEQLQGLASSMPGLSLWDYLSAEGLGSTPEGISELINTDNIAPTLQAIAQDILDSGTAALADLEGKAAQEIEKSFGSSTEKIGEKTAESFGKSIESKESTAEAAAESVATGATETLMNTIEDAVTAGEETTESYAESIEDGTSDASTAGKNVATGASSAMSSGISAAYANGAYTVIGFMNGAMSKYGQVIRTGQTIAGGFNTAFAAKMEINSPSKVFERFGEYTMAGYVNGLEQGAQGAVTSMERISGMISGAAPGVTIPGVSMASSAAAGGMGYGVPQVAEMIRNALDGVRVEIDGVAAGRLLAPTINAIVGAQAREEMRYSRGWRG